MAWSGISSIGTWTSEGVIPTFWVINPKLNMHVLIQIGLYDISGIHGAVVTIDNGGDKA